MAAASTSAWNRLLWVGGGAAGGGYLSQNADLLLERFRTAVSTGSAGGGAEVRALRQSFEAYANKVDLALLSRQGGHTVVLHDSKGRSSGYIVMALACGVFVYLRYLRGVGLEDLKLCTASNLSKAVGTLGRSLAAVNALVDNVRAALVDRIEHLGLKVDDVQDDVVEIKGGVVEIKDDVVEIKDDVVEIKDDVVEIKDDVFEIKYDVVEIKDGLSETKSLVERCDRRLVTASAKQDFACRGIHALCSVVGELLEHAQSRSTAVSHLRNFTLIGDKSGHPGARPPPLAGTPDAPAPEDELEGVFTTGGLSDRLRAIEAMASRTSAIPADI